MAKKSECCLSSEAFRGSLACTWVGGRSDAIGTRHESGNFSNEKKHQQDIVLRERPGVR